MSWLADVNFLLALCYDAHPHHKQAMRWLNDERGAGKIGVCRVSQLGLLRLLNNPVVMDINAQSCAQCWAVYDALMADARFTYLEEPEGLERELRSSIANESFTPKLWQDAYLLAFAKAGAMKLITFDEALGKRQKTLVNVIG